MSAVIFTVALMFTFITLVIARPNRISREVSSPTKVSLSQIRGGITDSSGEVQVDQCVPVMDTKLPTELHVHIDQPSSYAFTSFSSSTCNDDSILIPRSNELTNPIQLNGRNSICSFKLGKDPWPTAPVTISFSYKKGNVQPYVDIQDQSCRNVCNGSWESKYPHLVSILEQDGRIANNYIELYSGNNCQDGTQISNNEVRNGEDLATLTQINKESTIKAFRITKK